MFTVEFWLPPTSLVFIALIALVIGTRHGRTVALVSTLLVMLLSLSVVSLPLLASLDIPDAPLVPLRDGGPGAIVILSADVQRTGVPGLGALGAMTLERERAGAALARETGLPVLVTGGLVTLPPPVGSMMAASMAADFGVYVRWAETRSATTWENAAFSVPILRAAGVRKVYLVTHAWHMRRALLAFRRAGMIAEPRAVLPDPWPAHNLGDFRPLPSNWERSYLALHEWLGLFWYTIRPGMRV